MINFRLPMKARKQNYSTNGKRLHPFLHENCWVLLSKDCTKKHPINYFISNREIFMVVVY